MKLTPKTAPKLFKRLSLVKGGIEFDGQFFPYEQYRWLGDEGYCSESILNIGERSGKAHDIFRLIEYIHAENLMNYVAKHGPSDWLSPWLHYTDIRQDYLKFCRNCGELYYCQAKWAKYCSDACHPKISREEKRRRGRVNYWRNRRIPPQPIQCAVCGLEFTPKRKTRKTCSDKCRKALSRRV